MAMRLKEIVLLAALLSIAPFAIAGYGSENPRLEKLYGTFISPCCWRENLTVHDSQIAQELRARIATMVRSGRSDDEIKSALVAQYSKQILALPEGTQRVWLFLTPLAVAAAGLAAVSLRLKRLMVRSGTPVPTSLPPASMAGWEED
jgi:cytochrome c-type biogenesis protein CcmH/NrfF